MVTIQEWFNSKIKEIEGEEIDFEDFRAELEKLVSPLAKIEDEERKKELSQAEKIVETEKLIEQVESSKIIIGGPLTLNNCEKIKVLSTSSKNLSARIAGLITVLTVKNCQNLELISAEWANSLTKVIVEDCPKLESVSLIVDEALLGITIKNCPKLVDIQISKNLKVSQLEISQCEKFSKNSINYKGEKILIEEISEFKRALQSQRQISITPQ